MKHSKKNFSKPVLFLAASLIACQPVSALGVTFSDLDKVPWPGAETSIQKAADLGRNAERQNHFPSAGQGFPLRNGTACV